MKAYVHYENPDGSSADAYTYLLKLDGPMSAISAIGTFLSAYPYKALEGSKMCLMSESGEILGGDDIRQWILDRDDLFVRQHKAGCTLQEATRSLSSVGKEAPKNKPEFDIDVEDEAGSLKKLIQLHAEQRFRVAIEGCELLLKTASKQARVSVLTLLADMYLRAERLDDARSSAQLLFKANKHDPDAVLLLAKCMIEQEDFDEAQDLLEELVAIKERVIRSCGVEDGQDKVLRAVAMQGYCLMCLGQSMEAANVLNSHLSMPGADSHASLLAAYGELALRHDKLEESIRALLKALVVEHSDTRARELFARAVLGDAGMAEVLRQVPAGPTSAPALAFLGTVAKDGSALKAAANFYRRALSSKSDSASYALNLVHVLEALDAPEEALKETCAFLRANPGRTFGASGCSCADFLDAVERAMKGGIENTDYVYVEIDESDDRHIVHVRHAGEEDVMQVMPSAVDTHDDNMLDLLALGFTAVKVLYGMGRINALPSLFGLLEPSRASSKEKLHETSIRNEHAYYQCIAMVLSARSAAAERYYAALGDSVTSSKDAKLLACANPLTDPRFKQAATRPLYVCGDSHTISLAWAVLNTASGPRLVVPKLVTGVKHWHLRPESFFYPKANFFNVVRGIPTGADVLMVLGEIDCREGILVAVEKGKYKSIDAGIEKTVQVFSKVAARLVKEKRFKIAIHPIPPVIDETRPMVVKYSGHYKKAMDKTKGVEYLDFQAKLLDPSGQRLRAEYNLDRTHIHPSYVALIEKFF